MHTSRFTAFLLGSLLLCASLHAQLLPASFRQDSNGDGIADGWYDDTAPNVKHAFHLETVDGQAVQVVERLGDGNLVRVSATVQPVRPQSDYLLEGWVQGDVRWAVYWYEFPKKGDYLTHSQGNTNKKWTRFSQIIHTASDTFSFKISLGASGIGTVRYRDVQLHALDTPPALSVPQLAAAPALKADWNDPVWQLAAPLRPFTLLGPELKFPTAATQARIGFYDKTLHVILKLQEPNMKAIKLNEDILWNKDTIEALLLDENSTFCHFGIAADGTHQDEAQLAQNVGYRKDWHSYRRTGQPDNVKAVCPPWQSAASKQADGWTAQFAITIPDAILNGRRICRLQLGRSRKYDDIEENSAWGRIPGKFFKDETRYARLALPAPVLTDQAAAAEPAISAPPVVPGTLIVPAPQHATIGDTIVSWSLDHLTVSSNAADPRTLDVLKRIFTRRYAAVIATDDQAPCIRLETAPDSFPQLPDNQKLQDWQAAEAYQLLFDHNTAVIRARTHRGFVYGLQSLLQLTARENGTLFVRTASITDWPDTRLRGWHLMSPSSPAEFASAEQLIDTFAALKMNWLSYQFDNRFQYERHPSLSNSNPSTKEQHKKLAALLDLYDIDIIPMTQCFSHFNYFLAKPEWKHLAEVQNPDPNARWKFWNYCPRHPEVHKIVFDMIEEHLECYPKAKWYHVGLDEITFEDIGVCDRCKDATGGELLAEEINRLHDFLAKKGLRMCMWGDQLLVEHNGGKRFKTAEALPKVPRDVVIFDWHYNSSASYPSVKFFQDLGFEVMPSCWFNLNNVDNFAKESRRQNTIGYAGTTWTGVNNMATAFQTMAAIVVGGERMWKQNPGSLDSITYNAKDWFAQTFNGVCPSRPTAFRTLRLDPWMNTALTGGGSYGWLDLPPELDASAFAKLPRVNGNVICAGIPFRSPAGPLQAIVLASGQESDYSHRETTAWQLPVGLAAQALAFLHTCSVPANYTTELYDRNNVNPRIVAKYVVHYTDGAITEIPLHWDRQMTSWNAPFGASYCRTGWRGFTPNGAQITFDVLTWQNPKPETAIRAIDFVSSLGTVNPVLFGITAITTADSRK